KKMLQEKQAQLAAEKVKNDIALEEERGKLVDLTTENERKQSDAKAYDMQVLMKVFDTMDPNVVNALAMSGMDPKALIAKAFVEIGDKAEKISTLNVSPELLEALTAQR
ncbi:MAG: SPFH domain-containing protein, partial [Lachnospiraceae bacterium]|nr:SPFH domain-containing protein [Lachnospiraceae bacterium]